ncbi:MAG: phage integrase SAM-like domain-containing protein, partial [Thermoguttaceae bacterium]
MASISTNSKGLRRILFFDAGGTRKQVRVGKMPMKTTQTVKTHIENLLAAQLGKHAIDRQTAEWLGDLNSVLYGRLEAVGLVPKRESGPDGKPQGVTLAGFIKQYIDARPGMKPNTLKNYRQTERSLVEFFGTNRLLSEITAGDCDDWKASQEAKGHAPATIGRNVKRARQYFRAAVRKRLLADNPMQDVKAPAQVNTARAFYVSREATEKIIAACPDAEWRLIVALARYGGLRTPSETFALTWADVD